MDPPLVMTELTPTTLRGSHHGRTHVTRTGVTRPVPEV